MIGAANPQETRIDLLEKGWIMVYAIWLHGAS
jgi:hypothetical protein